MSFLIKGKADHFVLGDYNAVCDMCGSKFKAYQLKKTWDGSMRCPTCWEPRHPQEFVRGAQDQQTPPWTRNGGEDILLYVCTINGQSAIPDWAYADCSIPENEFIDPGAPV